jgi:hypothetical protein
MRWAYILFLVRIRIRNNGKKKFVRKKRELIALSSAAKTAAAKNVHAHIDVCTPAEGWRRAIESLPDIPVLARVQKQGLK